MDAKEELKSIPIAEVVERLGGLGLKTYGNSLQGNCPTGHESKGGHCFSINTNENYYHCFHCAIGGDVISLVKLVKQIEFLDALRWLAETFRPDLLPNIQHSKISETEDKTNYTQAVLYDALFQHGKELLYSDVGKDALQYLTNVRKYDIEKLKLTDWIYYPLDKHIREYLLKQFPEAKESINQLHLQGYYGDKFRLAFPYKNRRGVITGFVKRALEPTGITIETYDGKTHEGVRYDSTTGMNKDDLFNLHRCKEQKDLIIVEGYPDALYLHTLGLNNMVAVGQALLSQSHLIGLKTFGVQSITISFDNDPPDKTGKITGVENTAKAIEMLKDTGIRVYVVNPSELGEYKDADELVRDKGIDAFTELCNKAELGHKWMVKHIISKHDLGTDKGKDKVYNDAMGYIKSLTNPKEAGQCIDILENSGFATDKLEIEYIPNALEDLPEIHKILCAERKSEYIGLQTGFTKLDKATLGLRGLTVIGGIPGQGKTSLAGQVSTEIARINSVPALYYALEMSKNDLYIKTLSRLSKLDYTTLMIGSEINGRRGQGLSDADLHKLNEAVAEYSVYADKIQIIDRAVCPNISASLVKQHIQQAIQKFETDQCFVVIDHLQIFPVDKPGLDDMKSRLDYLVSEFKAISEQTGAVILLISEKNRQSYDKNYLGVYMGSAGIEYGVDIAMQLYEEGEENGKKKIDVYEASNKPKKLFLILNKQRFGGQCKIPMTFNGPYSNFEED